MLNSRRKNVDVGVDRDPTSRRIQDRRACDEVGTGIDGVFDDAAVSVDRDGAREAGVDLADGGVATAGGGADREGRRATVGERHRLDVETIVVGDTEGGRGRGQRGVESGGLGKDVGDVRGVDSEITGSRDQRRGFASRTAYFTGRRGERDVPLGCEGVVDEQVAGRGDERDVAVIAWALRQDRAGDGQVGGREGDRPIGGRGGLDGQIGR